MATILSVFIIALIISLAIILVAGILGERHGALDIHTARKGHTRPVPISQPIGFYTNFELPADEAFKK